MCCPPENICCENERQIERCGFFPCFFIIKNNKIGVDFQG